LSQEQISGGRREKEAQNGSAQTKLPRRVLMNERLTGEFRRTFTFPTLIMEEDIQASVENGLLYLVVPKKEILEGQRLGRKIAVNSGGIERLGAFTG